MFLSDKVKRIIAWFFITEVLFSTSVIIPANALTSGTHQPEYTSYEPNVASDLVNLATGDFTYSLPILNVPSPEGGFSLPLSYHSGIGLEDEASWVGLGWNVNVGAINRSKIGTADDALDELIQMRVTDPGGSGYVKNYGFYQKSWDSNKGYGGSINLMNIAGYSWTGNSGPLSKPRNLKDGSVMGLTFNKDNAHFNPTQFAQGVMAVGMMVGSGGIGNAPLGTQLAFHGVTGAISAAQGISARNTSSGTSYGQVGEWITETNKGRGKIDYKYWLDATRTEHAYGALYLGQMAKNSSISVSPGFENDGTFRPRVGSPGNYKLAPLFRQGVYYASGTESIVSDMHMYVAPTAEYAHTLNPTSIAYDSYSVMGPGVSGSMTPYRPDVGSLIYPKKMSELTHKFNLFPFMEEGNEIDKIQFRFEGDLSNTYRYHDSGGPGTTQSYSDADNRLYYQAQDPKLTVAAQRTEADRNGLYGKKLAQNRHVEWFSNQEMNSGVPQRQGRIIGYQPENTNELPFAGYNYGPERIGAFAVTAPDGTTYHYSLPVYNLEEHFFRGVTGQEGTKYADIKNSMAYATSWLLTSITGPDFVDRGISGQLDKEDLGYWVKFDYGRLAQRYNWRFPYVGYTKEGGFSSFSRGKREVYYLNSIQTRTHTAIFLKDIRKDGRASYRRSSTSTLPGMDATDDPHPASSLLLKEIALLNNADYEALLNQGFNAASQAGRAATAAYLNAPQGTATAVISSLQDLYDVYDVAQSSTFRSFLDQKAVRRIVFNTSYQLCRGTPNSFDNATAPPNLDGSHLYANRLGKLTLNSVSCYGPGNNKLMPDFRFEYNSPNPRYSSDAWDGWGAYNSNGYYNHEALNSDPTAWHLTDIIAPLGGRTTVTYERDDYSSVSGESILQRVPITGFSTSGYDGTHGLVMFNTNAFAPYRLDELLSNGAQVTFKELVAKQKGNCWDGGGSFSTERDYAISATQRVQGMTSNGFVITRPPVYGGHGNSFQGCGTCTWTKISGYLEVQLPQKKGGNARVAAITAQDEANNQYKTLYRYTTDGTAQGRSSGVVAQEPAFISTVDYPFYQLFDFPSTSVLYNKVHVLEGINSNGTYTSRTEYTFTTPRADMVQVRNTTSEVLTMPDKFTSFFSKIENAKRYYYDVESHTSEIGRLERIRLLDKDNIQVGQSSFEYSSTLPGNQGIYTTGSIMSEFERAGQCKDGSCPPSYFKFVRTNKTYYPSVLQTIRTNNNGISSVERNTAWDFITGAVLETVSEDALGNYYKSIATPAYTRYPALRSKVENTTNKHILNPVAESYTYKLDANGVPQEIQVASAETWSNSWTRRVANTTGQFETVSAALPVWRPQNAYTWLAQGASSTGGTPLAAFTSFKWGAGSVQHSAWKQVSTLARVNEYSASTEMRDVLSSVSSAIKFGYGQSQVISQASNARYGEFAYSGAEDGSPNSPFFGGEVAGANMSSTDVSHTGRYSLKLSATNPKGFVFNTPVSEQEGVQAGRTYRAAVWIHKSDMAQQQGQLVATLLNGTTTSALLNVTLASAPMKQAGDWCLLQGYFTVPASATGQRIEISCQTRQGTVYFDDFRFAPVDATSSAIVYDTQTWNPLFQLDNNNFYTQLEYDQRGQLTKTYREVLSATAPRKLVSERTYNYARDRQYTITTTVGSGQGSIAPAGTSTLGIGDALTVTATGVSCNWALSPTFYVDNVAYGSATTLSDGTQVQLVDGVVVARNIGGNHTIQVSFSDMGYPEYDTWFEAYCEVDGNGCYTGNSIWLQADGCGGYLQQEVRSASSLQCTNPPGSDCNYIHY